MAMTRMAIKAEEWFAGWCLYVFVAKNNENIRDMNQTRLAGWQLLR